MAPAATTQQQLKAISQNLADLQKAIAGLQSSQGETQSAITGILAAIDLQQTKITLVQKSLDDLKDLLFIPIEERLSKKDPIRGK